jgi:hypothetical protein
MAVLAYHPTFCAARPLLEKREKWRTRPRRIQSCPIGHYFIGEKSVGRMYVTSIVSTVLLACSALSTS